MAPKSHLWLIREDLMRAFTTIGEQITAHIGNSDKRYEDLEARLCKAERAIKKKKCTHT